MIPPQKFGKLLFLNPAKGVFMIAIDGEKVLETKDPAEAKKYIKDWFAAKIDDTLTPLIRAEGYDLAQSFRDGRKSTAGKGKKAVSELPAKSQALFDRFWQAYPKKVAKAAAVKAWKKLDPDEALTDKIIHALETQGKVYKWCKNDGEFIPHAATWLNGKRWEDVITAPMVTSGGSSFDLKVIMDHAKTHKPEV